MLHVFIGKDTVVVRAEAHAHLETYGDVAHERITLENYAPGMLASRAGSVDLFGGMQVVVIDSLSEDEVAHEELLESAERLASATDHFVILDGKLPADAAKKLKKHATTFVERSEVTEGERFNTFALADALSRRDKKSLWVLLQRARRAGIAAEEIIGTLFWQVKMLRLASTTNSAKEAGVKDFVYNKAKRAVKEFKDGELEALSERVVRLYHDGHLGKVDIDIALEKLTLTV